MHVLQYAPGAVAIMLVIALVVGFRWLITLQRRVNDHAERIAHIEGQRDGS